MQMMMRNSSSSSGYPFTPTQWQELEHQALIYKYMASGIPIPSDLLLPIRRSFFLDSTTIPPPPPPPPHFSHQPNIGGWGCFHHHHQMGMGMGMGMGPGGYGRKAEDPEPGRCRRTDGKKWRCSKEAYPESKYCERHMHRGKNRSRKPVELVISSLNNNINSTTSTAPNSNPSTTSMSTSSSSLINQQQYPSLLPSPADQYPYQLNYPPHHPYTHNSERDYNRFFQGMKDVDEYTFFSEATSSAAASTGGRGNSWELRPLGLGEPKVDYNTKEEEEEVEKNEHCFVLGADFKMGGKSAKEEENLQRPLRHFFDESPHKSSRDSSWLGLEGDSSNTQLSISIPMDFHHLPPHWFVTCSSSSTTFSLNLSSN